VKNFGGTSAASLQLPPNGHDASFDGIEARLQSVAYRSFFPPEERRYRALRRRRRKVSADTGAEADVVDADHVSCLLLGRRHFYRFAYHRCLPFRFADLPSATHGNGMEDALRFSWRYLPRLGDSCGRQRHHRL
jgi:hypothetical protein